MYRQLDDNSIESFHRCDNSIKSDTRSAIDKESSDSADAREVSHHDDDVSGLVTMAPDPVSEGSDCSSNSGTEHNRTPDVSIPPPDVSIPPPDVSIPPPDVSVPPPDVSFPPPDVSIPPPDVSIPPPDVSFPPPDVSIPPPDVSVRPPDVSVRPPDVSVPPPDVSDHSQASSQTLFSGAQNTPLRLVAMAMDYLLMPYNKFQY